MKHSMILLLVCLCFTACAENENQKTVLVSGANRGLGLEFAKQFHERGYIVIATARKPEQAEDLKAIGVKVEQLDVSDPLSVSALAKRMEKQPIDILLNNAGIRGDVSWQLKDAKIDEWIRTFEVNSIGPVRVAQALIDNLRLAKTRKVLSISSGMGSIKQSERGGLYERGGSYDYRASKSALNMFNQTMATEFGKDGFTFVVLHPGWVKTDMGGSSAQMAVEESVSKLIKVIEGLSKRDNGKFLDYEGNKLPW